MKNEDIIKRYEQHRSDRSTIEGTWDIIERYIYPLGGGKFFQDQTTEGEMDWNRSRYIFDSTAIMAHQTLAASIHSNITSPTDKWFDLRFKQTELNNDLEAVQWLESCGNEVYQALQESNFNLEINKSYMDLTAMGNTCIVEEVPSETEWQGIDFSSVPIREIFFDPDKKGQICNLYRRLQWEPSRIISKFGMDNVPQDIRDRYEAGNLEKQEIVFCIYKRMDKQDADVTRMLAPMERPYGYKYILKKGQETLGEEGGYYEMPAFFAPWAKASGSKWGYGPGFYALGDTITLNTVVQMTLSAAAKAIDPPVLTQQRNIIGDMDLQPAGETVVRDIGGTRPYESGAKFDVSNLLIDRLQDAIRRQFHNHQLELKESPAMTATEVQVRYELMQKVLGTVLGQLQTGLLDPIVQRTFNILTRAGRLPQMPEQIAALGGSVEIEYTGPMSRSQKSDKAVSMERFMMTLSQVGQIFPEMMDLMDVDQYGRKLAEYMGVPADALRDAEEVANIRKQRQQAQAQQMQLEQTQAQAKAMKDGGQGLASLAQASGGMNEPSVQ
jgi:hypothetical protein